MREKIDLVSIYFEKCRNILCISQSRYLDNIVPKQSWQLSSSCLKGRFEFVGKPSSPPAAVSSHNHHQMLLIDSCL